MANAPRITVNQSIQGTLTQRAGRAPDVARVVEAVTRTWQFMSAQLEPVIGARGVEVLLDRALYVSGKNFPWLDQPGPPERAADAVAYLHARFASREAHDAAEAGCALLVTFTELLSNLIGESLTERLLASVWIEAPPTTELDAPHD